MHDLLELLSNNPYPGRGIVVGRNAAGLPVVFYWIMGRSTNSRNRIFERTDDGIRTKAFDESKLEDPSLIIYHPVRTMGNDLVVTNGDQTDTIVEAQDFMSACMSRSFEPDEPNWTPRISCILHEDGSFALSILKNQADDSNRCQRNFFYYEGVEAGQGYFISTYEGDGSPLPSFAGEPKAVSIPTADDVWAALNTDNKVSLYARCGTEVRLFNKHLGD